MTLHPAMTISFIGFGEVGQTFCRDLNRNACSVRLCAWDRLFPTPDGARLAAMAETTGVAIATSARAAMIDADVVISAVTADQALVVAESAAQDLIPGQIFLDVNSAAPNTKIEAARLVTLRGAGYVEAAIMQPVQQPGLAVPILTGGPQAAALADVLNPMGMNMRAVATAFGRASAMKLSRSILIKGLEILTQQSAAAAAAWGVQDEVFASLAETFPSINWPALTEQMRHRVSRHGIRRAAEMREVAAMLADLSHHTDVVLALAAAQERYADLDSDPAQFQQARTG